MKGRTAKPPRVASWMLEYLIQKDIRDGAMGDFDEQFYWMIEEKGVFKARLHYWRQIGGTLPYFLKNAIIWNSFTNLFVPK
jgi:hypothetical protein